MTLPAGQVRNLPHGGQTRTVFVPLLSPPDGEEMVGFIRVPLDLVGTMPLTNARHRYRKFIAEHLKRWVEWKARQGWYIATKPVVQGPFDPPTEHPGAPSEGLEEFGEHKRYTVTARFKRTEPKWMPLDSMLWVADKAALYDIDLHQPINDTGAGRVVKEIVADEPAHDPLRFAEERRQRLGLKRADYLFTEGDKQ